MHVHALAWIVLAGIIVTMIVVDIVGHVRTPHEPTLKEATWWSIAYIAIALIFGGIVWALWGPQYGQEYLGGYITEKALSIDNLFVFVIILSTFRVPRKNQQEVLLAGIVIEQLEKMAKEGPSAEHMQKIKEYMLKKYKDAQKENSYWLGNLDEYFYTGIDYTKDYETLVNSITAKDVQEFLAKLMKQNNEIQVIMTIPEEEAK